MIHVHGTAGRVHVLRLTPGADVRAALNAWCTANGIAAAALVSAVGSLSRAAIRFAGRNDAHDAVGDLEVCSLSGTLSKHGMHLHLTASDAQGQVIGGHVLDGCTVRTTLELVVQEVDGVELLRTLDPATGFAELDPRVR